jgi:hypothetical protein
VAVAEVPSVRSDRPEEEDEALKVVGEPYGADFTVNAAVGAWSGTMAIPVGVPYVDGEALGEPAELVAVSMAIIWLLRVHIRYRVAPLGTMTMGPRYDPLPEGHAGLGIWVSGVLSVRSMGVTPVTALSLEELFT